MTPLSLTLRLELNGRPFEGFPITTAGLTVAKVHLFRLAHSPEPDVYEPLPTETVDVPTVLAVAPKDADVLLRAGVQQTSNVPIKAGGLFLVWEKVSTQAAMGLFLRTDMQTHTQGVVAG